MTKIPALEIVLEYGRYASEFVRLEKCLLHALNVTQSAVEFNGLDLS